MLPTSCSIAMHRLAQIPRNVAAEICLPRTSSSQRSQPMWPLCMGEGTDHSAGIDCWQLASENLAMGVHDDCSLL